MGIPDDSDHFSSSEIYNVLAVYIKKDRAVRQWTVG